MLSHRVAGHAARPARRSSVALLGDASGSRPRSSITHLAGRGRAAGSGCRGRRSPRSTVDHGPVVQLERRPASAVIARPLGGAASGTTSAAVKRKRSSPRVVPVKVGLLIRSPLPSAVDVAAARRPTLAAEPVVGLDQEQRRRAARAPPAAARPSGSPRSASRAPARPPWLRRRRRAGSRARAGCPPAAPAPPASVAKSVVILRAFITPSASEASAVVAIVRGAAGHHLARPAARAGPSMCRRRSPSVTIPTSAPPASTTPTTPKPLAAHLDQRLGHRRVRRDQRHLVARVHQVADRRQPRPEPPARMQAAEVLRA